MSFKNFQKGHAPILVLLIIVIVASLGAYLALKGKFDAGNLLKTTPLNPNELTLTLDSPNQYSKALDDEIYVRGKTLPNITVVLFNESDEEILQSDAMGNFEGKLLLGKGENQLTITAFSDTGEERSLSLEVLYNPET